MLWDPIMGSKDWSVASTDTALMYIFDSSLDWVKFDPNRGMVAEA